MKYHIIELTHNRHGGSTERFYAASEEEAVKKAIENDRVGLILPQWENQTYSTIEAADDHELDTILRGIDGDIEWDDELTREDYVDMMTVHYSVPVEYDEDWSVSDVHSTQ